MGFNEIRAIVDLFLQGRSAEEAKAQLHADESKVFLRYIAEEVVSRYRVENFAQTGAGTSR